MADEKNTASVTPAEEVAKEQVVETPEKEVESKQEVEKEQPASKTLTQEEVNRIIAERLQKEREKWEKKLEEEKELAKLSEEERQKAILEKKEQELREKERQLRLKENQLEAVRTLTREGIPMSFVDLVVHEDRAVMLERIEKVRREWREALEQKVKQELKGEPPVDVSNKPEPEEPAPTVI